MIRTPSRIIVHAKHLAVTPKLPTHAGLGDAVAVVAEPVAKLLDKMIGTKLVGCGGCAKRREMFNKLVPDILHPFTPKQSAVPASWAELHLRGMTHEGEQDLLWLAIFGARISGAPDWKNHWRDEIIKVPPDFKNYFFWTVAIHNVVNARLGKPQVTIDEARKIWANPSPADPAGLGPAPLDLKM